jgi:hypothetical protein
MTAKREAELETENRMLREQVASLEKIVGQMAGVQYIPWYVPNGNMPYWYYQPVTWSGVTTSSGDGSGIGTGTLSSAAVS